MAFLSLRDISSQEFSEIINKAIAHKNGSLRFEKVLAGKHLGLLFEKSSTRTIVSFQVAIADLGGNAILLSAKDLQLSRGERIKETAMVLEGYLDGLVIRTHSHKMLEEIAELVDFPVVNALSELYHPCQTLADFMTITEEGFALSSTRVCFVGDGSSNVAHSLIMGSVHSGTQLLIASPKKYRPREDVMEYAEQKGALVSCSEDVEAMVQDADVLYTDVWASMGDEAEQEERKKHLKAYQINEPLLNKARAHAIIMHCMPAHLGEEITESAFNSSQSRIIRQAHNRLFTAKTLLLHLYS